MEVCLVEFHLNNKKYPFLCQGAHVFAGVCIITQKVMDKFDKIFQELLVMVRSIDD